MQAPDGSSTGARSALMAIAADLKLPPHIMARALEYAFDNLRTFPSASQALCFGIVQQGYYVDTQLMEIALQRLRRRFGGVFYDVGRQTITDTGSDSCQSDCAARASGTVVRTASYSHFSTFLLRSDDRADPK